MSTRWFDEGCAALRRVRPEVPPEIYVCPPCVDGWGVDALDTRLLTLEHVPAGKAHGKELVLTCKPCNNTDGSRLDKPAVRQHKMMRFLARHPNVKIRADLLGADGFVHRGEAWWTADGHLHHSGIPQQNGHHPRGVDDYADAMNSGEIRIALHFDVGDERLAAIASLRAAYLAAFAVWGYTYILRPELDSVREMIRTPDDGRPVAVSRYDNGTGTGTIFDLIGTRQIGFVVDGPDWAVGNVLVNIDHYGIFLPGFGESPAKLAAHLSNARPAGAMRMRQWEWPTQPRYEIDWWGA